MDELQTLYHIGAFQSLTEQLSSPSFVNSLEPEDKAEVRVLKYKTLIAQGKYNSVIQEVTQNDPLILIALRLLASYLSNPSPEFVDHCIEISSNLPNGGPGLASVLSIVLLLSKNYNECLKVLNYFPRNLECVALTIQVYSHINRVDLAYSTALQMKQWVEETSLSQMVDSWIGIIKSDPGRYEEAYYLYEELAGSHIETSKILCSKAVCHILSRRFEDSETYLKSSLAKFPNDANSLINMIVVCHCLERSEDVVQQYMSRLMELSPSHYFLKEMKLKEASFDELCQKYTL